MSAIQCVVCHQEKAEGEWTIDETLGPTCHLCAERIKKEEAEEADRKALSSTGWSEEISDLMNDWEQQNPDEFEKGSEVKPT